MDHVPTPAELGELLRPLDNLDKKVLGGLVASWMAEPARVRDREWTAQTFVQVATVAHGFDGEQGPATSGDVERIRVYAQECMDRVVRVGLALFVRVAADLRERGTGFTFADAQAAVVGYLG
jgi:hypothetical protein